MIATGHATSPACPGRRHAARRDQSTLPSDAWDAHPARPAQSPQTHRSAAIRWPVAGASVDPPVTGRCCARHESARNAGGTPGCGTADGAARRTRGTQTGSPPVPAGPGCRRPACGAPAQREAAPAPAAPVRTRNAGTRVRTHRIGSPAPTPALCRAAAARAAGCSMRSCIHGKAAVSPAGTARSPEAAAQNGMRPAPAVVAARRAPRALA